MNALFDTHAHLDQPEFDADRDEVLQRAAAAGVGEVLCVGTTAESSAAAVGLADTHPGVYAAVGVQPNYTSQVAAGDWDRVLSLVDRPKVVALGETGLDRYWDYAPLPVQQDYFDRHLQLAQQRGLPVLIHCREAEAEVLVMLRQATQRGPVKGLLHAFSGTADLAAECLALGLYISLAGNVSYTNKKFGALRAVAATIPADRLLLETDSPYLTPHPLRGREKRNEPAWIVHTAESLAALRGVTVQELARQTTANARRLFGLHS
jgi:TatD DNase family protein